MDHIVDNPSWEEQLQKPCHRNCFAPWLEDRRWLIWWDDVRWWDHICKCFWRSNMVWLCLMHVYICNEGACECLCVYKFIYVHLLILYLYHISDTYSPDMHAQGMLHVLEYSCVHAEDNAHLVLSFADLIWGYLSEEALQNLPVDEQDGPKHQRMFEQLGRMSTLSRFGLFSSNSMTNPQQSYKGTSQYCKTIAPQLHDVCFLLKLLIKCDVHRCSSKS